MAIPFYDRWSWGQFLRKPPIKEGKLLDVGCFYGEFLSIAVGMYDYKVKGIDINRAAVEQGRKKYGLESLYPPEHLTGWSAKALRNFLTSHGF
ncbi:MAG: class I SAM-dependent methyltransferase [Candidatus Thermoplasmatota archaeon]|nr:class I SAM-dependent methyltransferase [Candidatus Thermoplasmatota archaeon]